MATPKALLFVFSSPGDKVTTEEFNAWYDDEHAPNRARTEGILSATRYSAVDGKEPEWLATYDLENAAVLQSAPYKQLWENNSAREKGIVSRVKTLDRRVYEFISSKTGPNHGQSTTKLVSSVELEPGSPDLSDEEFNKWYEEEHLPLLSQCPGFLRATRWKLKEGSNVARYMAFYEVEGPEFTTSAEFKHATSTPWRNEVIAKINTATDNRRAFKVHRAY